MNQKEKTGVRNYRISTTHGFSGYFAVMLADYEDMDWSTDVVKSGVGRYQSREEAEMEGRMWALAEEIPFLENP